jgi:hypothetical protein
MTSLNTVFGAIVGSLPLLIGIANNKGLYVLSYDTLEMSLYLFLW